MFEIIFTTVGFACLGIDLAMMLEQQQLQSEVLSLLSARIDTLRDRVNEMQFRVENGY
jgi:hypothetical protein